jgi:hypothetical protein
MKSSRQIYCAFCGTKRSVYNKKHITFGNGIETLVLSLLLMLLLFEGIDFRVIMIWVVFLTISEILIQFRWRLSVNCGKCGFDPILYKQSPEKASALVKNHIDRARLSPSLLTSTDVLKKIPYKTSKGNVINPNLISKKDRSLEP